MRLLKITGVDTAVAVDSMDAVVELTRMYLQRVTEVATHKVVHSHPYDYDIGASCTAHAASDK